MDNHDHPADERRLQAAERAELHSTDGSMSTCAVCGESLPDNRPAHRVVLEIEDRTRSTKQFMGDETTLKHIHFHDNLSNSTDRWDDRFVPEFASGFRFSLYGLVSSICKRFVGVDELDEGWFLSVVAMSATHGTLITTFRRRRIPDGHVLASTVHGVLVRS